MEITDIINEFLVNEDSRIEPTNISRALRGPVLRGQLWLETFSGPRYAVVDNWQTFWVDIFEEPAPINLP